MTKKIYEQMRYVIKAENILALRIEYQNKLNQLAEGEEGVDWQEARDGKSGLLITLRIKKEIKDA